VTSAKLRFELKSTYVMEDTNNKQYFNIKQDALVLSFINYLDKCHWTAY